MKILISLVGVCTFLFQSCTAVSAEKFIENRQRPFNSDWKFVKDTLTGAENPAFDDSKWRTLDLPHDWSIEDLPGPQTEDQTGPFSKKSPGGWLSGNTLGGTGWYRKHFTLGQEDKGKLVKVLFDGVMTESDVWINGKHLGYHPYGYTAFAYDLTPYLNPTGQSNVLAVRVKNIGFNSRWYSGSGIYRNVCLIVTNPLHIDLWGVYVTTPEVSEAEANVNLTVKVINPTERDADIKIKVRLIGEDGIVSGQAEKSEKIAANGNIESSQTIIIKNPELWSPDSPNLYRVVVDILSNGKPVDTYTMKTGIRSIKWDARNGLQINGKTVKLRGGNIHHDNGILGAAAFSRAEYRRIEILKENGFNAIRSSHYPPSTKFLEACDSLGMFVLDEAFDVWEKIKIPGDYNRFFKTYWKQDLESMLLRDRNHPSVIIWSIGNEIIERADPRGLEITGQLVGVIREFDTTRPVTEAINGFSSFFGGVHEWSYSAPAFALLDIGGYNYGWREWENDHKLYPERIMMTTESSSVDMFRIFTMVEKYPWIVGDFVWTGMDYLGESGCGAGYIDNEEVNYGTYVPQFKKGFGRGWPWFGAWCGDIDILGHKKPRMYYRDVLWNHSQMEMAVHKPLPSGIREHVGDQGWPDELQSWTWSVNDGDTMEVSVYTRCTSVRLELNGKVIGEKPISKDLDLPNVNTSKTCDVTPNLVARFNVPYAPGELKAVGITDGKVAVIKMLKTAGAPAKLVLTPDRSTIRADRNDLAFITVEVADENGMIIPNATVLVNFTISGNGELAAAGNGRTDQVASFRQPYFKTYNGKAMIIVRPFAKSGKITLKARSEGLSPKTVEINVVK
jgi:beta-galactosidase